MNRVFINQVEIASFESDQETINMVEQILNGNSVQYDEQKDLLEFELDGQGIIAVDCSDLTPDGRLSIF